MLRQYLFIVNPNAGKGKAGKKWAKIERFIQSKNVRYKAVLTTCAGHAIQVVEEELKLGYKCLVVVGGDGTVNEVVNGIFQQQVVPPEEICLGLLPVGTGNDWARYYGISRNYKKALERVFSEETHRQDIGRLTREVNGKVLRSYFANIAGFGFDAVVVKAVNETQERGNRLGIAYLYSLIRSLFTYKALPMHVEINGEVIEKKIFSISIGIGCYSGGGMLQTPNAVADDKLFDVTIYDDMSIGKVMRHVSKLYSGKIINVKGVNTYRTDKILVKDGPELMAETDGEVIEQGPFFIEILPSALNILI